MQKAAIVSRLAHAAHRQPPPQLVSGPWWRELVVDFHKRPEPFEPAAGYDRLRVGMTAALDTALRTLYATAAGITTFPIGYHPLRAARQRADGEFYGALAERGQPELFFRRPPRSIRMRTRRARMPLFRPPDGRCLDLRFYSPFVPVNPRERRAYLRHRRNRFAHARYWRHRDGPRPTVLAIHGFGADTYHLNEWLFALPRLYRFGCDVMLVTLPFHGPRRTALSPFSGHGFFSGGVARINEAIGQSIHDLRVFIDWLEDAGCPRMGITGVSLGGFMSAVAASVEHRLAFAVPTVPVVSIADLMLEWQPLGAAVALSLAANGLTIIDARRMLAVSHPLTYEPLLGRERLMIVGGAGDRLAPPKQARLLWDHWQRCRIHWFPGSHLVHLDRGDYLRQIERFMRDIDFV